MTDELIEYDAVALGELTRRDEISPLELLDHTIQRIEEFNPKLNAVIHKTYDQARETAENWSSKINTSNVIWIICCAIFKKLINIHFRIRFHAMLEFKGTYNIGF